MSKSTKTKKKRTKRYAGAGAVQGPVVRRYEAVDRSPVAQWWFDHKARVRIAAIAASVVVVIAVIVTGLITALR